VGTNNGVKREIGGQTPNVRKPWPKYTELVKTENLLGDYERRMGKGERKHDIGKREKRPNNKILWLGIMG